MMDRDDGGIDGWRDDRGMIDGWMLSHRPRPHPCRASPGPQASWTHSRIRYEGGLRPSQLIFPPPVI